MDEKKPGKINFHLEMRKLKQTELQSLLKKIEQEGEPKTTRGKEKVVRNGRP